jgi:hypothetical protein
MIGERDGDANAMQSGGGLGSLNYWWCWLLLLLGPGGKMWACRGAGEHVASGEAIPKWIAT